MSGAELLSLKQKLNQLNESERREVSAYLIRLGQEGESWKLETAQRLDQMQSDTSMRQSSESLRSILNGE